MDEDRDELIGRINLDVARWMQPQPIPTRTEASRPVATAAINWAKLHAVEHAVLVVLHYRRDQGIGWYGQEVHSHNGHDALAHSCQEAVDGYNYATQHRLEHDSPEAADLCLTWLQLIAKLVHLLDVRDNALDEQPTQEFVPPAMPTLRETERTERTTVPPPELTPKCCLMAARGLTFECEHPEHCRTYRPPT